MQVEQVLGQLGGARQLEQRRDLGQPQRQIVHDLVQECGHHALLLLLLPIISFLLAISSFTYESVNNSALVRLSISPLLLVQLLFVLLLLLLLSCCLKR